MIMKTKPRITVLPAGVIAKWSLVMLAAVFGLETVHAEDATAPPPQQVEIPGTQLLHITSAIVGQEYDLYVHLPRYYQDTTRTFPVAYLLDAQWDFPLVTAIWGQQYYDGFLPGMIIVGITWGGENPSHDALRARDLTPTNAKPIAQSGNAPKFLAFFKKELIPFIESIFRTTTDDRTLMGSSFGGLFTLYTLFQETELFNRYVLTSPALGWDNGIIYALEKNFAANNSELPVRLFMAIGEYEDVSGFQKFADQLKVRKYKGLALQTRILENTGHSGTKAEGFTRGLQFVFERPSLILAPARLEQYLGVYQSDGRAKHEIAREGNHLVLVTPQQGRIVLHAETETDFYVKGTYFFVRFKTDAAGKPAGLELEQFNGSSFLKKVK